MRRSPPQGRPQAWLGSRRGLLRLAVPLAVAGWAAWSLRGFLAPGWPVEFDAHSHLARAGFAAQALRAGSWPWWSLDWYGGWRLLEFYSPGWYVLVGAAGLAAGGIAGLVAAVKGALFAGQLAVALGLFAFARRLGLAAIPAAVVPLLFVASPERAWVIGKIGNHPSVLVYAGAVAWLWLAARPPAPRAGLAALAAPRALALAAMLVAHLQGALLVPGLAAFDVTRAAPTLGLRRALACLAATLVAAAALTAFLWIPLLADLGLVSLSLDAAARAPVPGAHPLLVAVGLEPFRWDTVFVRGHGLAWMALAAGAAVLAAARRPPDAAGLALGAGLAGALLALLLLGERAVLGLGLFAWPLVALAPRLVSQRVPGLLPGRLEPALALLLVAGALARVGLGERIEGFYAPPDSLAVYASLPATPTRSRTFDVTPRALCLDGLYGSSSAAPLLSGRGVALGAFPQGAPLAANLWTALLGRLGQEAQPSQASLDALYLAHVGLLVERGSRPRVVVLHDASPALFAPRLETLPASLAPTEGGGSGERLLAALRARWREDPLDEYRREPSLAPLARTRDKRDYEVVAPAVAAMQIDRSRGVAARIFVDGAPPASSGGAGADAGTGRLRVLGHRESPGGSAALDVDVPEAGWLRLAYAHDPRLEVSVDGRPVPFFRDALGAVVVAVPSGRHAIALRFEVPRGRVLLLVFCGLLAAVCVPVAARAVRAGA